MNDKNDSLQSTRVFYLSTPEQLFRKLDWEIDNLNEVIQQQDQIFRGFEIAGFHAFNAAVTAWHLSDWAWNSITQDYRKQIAAHLKFAMTESPSNNLKAFQQALRQISRALDICWDIANGSKHLDTHKHSKVNAKTEIKSKTPTAKEFQEGLPLQIITYDFIVDWNGQTLRIADVFAEARDFWMGFLADIKLIGEIYIKCDIDIKITRSRY